MRHLKFYVQHAFRDMTRNGARTIFALFCIAAGVAAIVSLRSLALMIGDSLAHDIAGTYHGDIWVEARGRALIKLDDGREAFSKDTVDAINQWAQKNNVQITSAITNANIQVASLQGTTAGRPQFISSFIIDPAVYPFYGPVLALDPSGVPLSKLFTGGNDVVISKNLADNQNIKVGDQVHVGRTTDLFTVRGIVPTEAESGVLYNGQGILSMFFGFAYFDKAQIPVFQTQDLPDVIYMQIPPDANVNDLDKSLHAAVPNIRTITTTEATTNISEVSDVIDRLIVLMGLAALLIGVTGIIHTMLVVVGRRMIEIAVLKTLGLKGSQITTMFLVESLLMGLAGSLLGVVLGIIFSFAVRAFMQNVWPQMLVWRVYPQAMGTGVLLGVLITAVFGFLPTLVAGAVRPAAVLRPNETKFPAMGCFQIFAALIFVVVIIGLVAGSVIGVIWLGMLGIVLSSIALLITIGILWVLVAIVGKLPSFGLTDLRLALRAIGSHRLRTASTMFSLVVGIFSLSAITLMASSVPRLLNVQLQSVFGGNVLVIEPIALLHPLVVAQLKNQPGVTSYKQIGLYKGELVAVNGNHDYVTDVHLNLNVPNAPKGARLDSAAVIHNALGSLSVEDVNAPHYQSMTVEQGRPLGPQDAGQHNVVLIPNEFSQEAGIKLGDTVTFQLQRYEVTFTIVGMTQAQLSGVSKIGALGNFVAPADAFPAGLAPNIQLTVAQVDDAHLNQTLVNLSSVPGVFPFDVSFFESLIKRLISQFTAIPTIVSVLALFSGAVVIANTVSLTTLERRRQVGVMKAIGLKGSRVLLQMVIENGIVGILGGLIGVGVGMIGTLLMSINSPISFAQSVDWGIALILLGLSLLIALVATLLSAWTAATEKPLNVLRYE